MSIRRPGLRITPVTPRLALRPQAPAAQQQLVLPMRQQAPPPPVQPPTVDQPDPQPQVPDAQPPGPDAQPPLHDGQLPAANGQPPAANGQQPAPDAQIPVLQANPVGQPQGVGPHQFAVLGHGMPNVLNYNVAFQAAIRAQGQANVALDSCMRLAKIQARADRGTREMRVKQEKAKYRNPADKKVNFYYSVITLLILNISLFFRLLLTLWMKSWILRSCWML